MVYVLFMFSLLFSPQQDKIPIPVAEAPYTATDIVIDETTGEKIICDQLVVVFAEDITRSEQLNVLLQISGKVVGGNPDMNLYHISFPNRRRSLSTQNTIIKKLDKNPRIEHVSARKEKNNNVAHIEIEMKNPERKGEINMSATGRNFVEKKDAMQEILDTNRETLLSCKRKKGIRNGEILFRLTINPQGELKEVKVLQSNIRDKNFLNCLEYKIRQWTGFPEQSGDFDRQVEFTFKF